MCLRSPQLSRSGAESQVPAPREFGRGAVRRECAGKGVSRRLERLEESIRAAQHCSKLSGRLRRWRKTVKRAPSVWFKPSLCTCPIAESEQYGCQWHPLQRILVGLKAS